MFPIVFNPLGLCKRTDKNKTKGVAVVNLIISVLTNSEVFNSNCMRKETTNLL